MNSTPEGIVWVKDGCPRCAAVKEHLSGRRVEYRQIEAVPSGEDPHRVDALAQLAWQDYVLPVVLLGGAFLEPEKLLPNACSPGASVCTLAPGNHAACREGALTRKGTIT